MRSSSPSVSPRARWSGCSATDDRWFSRVDGKPDGGRRVGRGCEPPSPHHAARAGRDLGLVVHVHRDRAARPRPVDGDPALRIGSGALALASTSGSPATASTRSGPTRPLAAARPGQHRGALLPDRLGPAVHRLRPRRDPQRLRAALHGAASHPRSTGASASPACGSPASSLGFAGVVLLVGFELGAAARAVAGGLAVVAASALLRDRRPLRGPALRRAAVPLVAFGTLVWATLHAALGAAQASAPAGRRSRPCSTSASPPPGAAYLLYFGLIAGAGASKAVLVTYLVPALALVYGAVFLDEQVTFVALAGLALVLAGSRSAPAWRARTAAAGWRRPTTRGSLRR